MEKLVKAAVIVLGDAHDRSNPSQDPADTLKQDVSLFLHSLQAFPHQPLPFALATYRDFFVLVAQWRHEEPAIDARHTIDSTRRWIELSSAPQRHSLDQTLTSHPQSWTGPFELTSTLLTLLRLEHADKEVVRVAHLLVDSLERAAKSVHAVGLLGILLDAFAELGWNESAVVSDMKLTMRMVGLLVGLVWRDQAQVRVAAGVLVRVGARGSTFAFVFAANLASTILLRLEHEADHSYAVILCEDTGPLVSIATIFRVCLDVMLDIGYETAKAYVQEKLHKPLSSLLSKMLERTIQDPNDERVAELDRAVTKLYDLCDRVLDEAPPNLALQFDCR